MPPEPDDRVLAHMLATESAAPDAKRSRSESMPPPPLPTPARAGMASVRPDMISGSELSDAASSASANALMESRDLWPAIGLGESSAETLAPQPHPVPELAPYFNDYMSKLKALNLPDSVLALLTHETLKTKIALDKETQDL